MKGKVENSSTLNFSCFPHSCLLIIISTPFHGASLEMWSRDPAELRDDGDEIQVDLDALGMPWGEQHASQRQDLTVLLKRRFARQMTSVFCVEWKLENQGKPNNRSESWTGSLGPYHQPMESPSNTYQYIHVKSLQSILGTEILWLDGTILKERVVFLCLKLWKSCQRFRGLWCALGKQMLSYLFCTVAGSQLPLFLFQVALHCI